MTLVISRDPTLTDEQNLKVIAESAFDGMKAEQKKSLSASVHLIAIRQLVSVGQFMLCSKSKGNDRLEPLTALSAVALLDSTVTDNPKFNGRMTPTAFFRYLREALAVQDLELRVGTND